MKFRQVLASDKIVKIECAVLVMVSLVSAMCGEVYASSNKHLDNINTKYESEEIPVTTELIQDNSAVYSLDVIWGGMNFRYSSGEWEPEEGGYNETSNWYVNTNTGNDIKVENHSNRSVNVSMSMEVDEDKYGQAGENPITSGFRDITDYSDGETLEECNYEDEGVEYEETISKGTVNAWGIDNKGQASVYSKELCFSGTLPEDFVDGSSIGVVTVTLTP